jgi:hypothetical protein
LEEWEELVKLDQYEENVNETCTSFKVKDVHSLILRGIFNKDMFIEEKIDRLKQQLLPSDLTIRYNDFGEVMTKIESKFLNKHLNYKFSGWIERVKEFSEKSFGCDFLDFLDKELLKDQKYWWVFVENKEPSSRHRLFDATIVGGYRLSFLFPHSPVFIVEKKYAWMLIVDRDQKWVRTLSKSGDKNASQQNA